MERWHGRVAVVTGASSGIGAATAIDLIKSGVRVVALARREEKLQSIRSSLPGELQKDFHIVKCDVSKEDEVKNVFSWIDKNLGGADILINNAGVNHRTQLIEPNNTEILKTVVDTNIWGVVYCIREAFNSMKTRKVNDGHVVILNSIAGHRVPNFGNVLPSFNIYPATKFAVTALTETYRQEFLNAGTNIKITSISPGAVETEIWETFDLKAREMLKMLRSEDVSDAIMYVLKTPPNVQIHELTIKPVGELC